jgi:formate-dependent nitrite reductase membrane component NrfD
MTTTARAPVPLIPATRQGLWGPPAVANFVLGGLGTGLYVVAVALARLHPGPFVTLAAWLAPLLVVAGLAAVAAEAGRPLRGARVIARLGTSWMSREAALGGLFVVLAAAEFVAPGPAARLAAALAAVAFAVAQGMIVRRARGVPAWDVAVMPVLFLVSSLVSGMGLLLLVDGVTARSDASSPLAATLPLLVAGLLVWLVYVTWSRDGAFLAATRPLREGAVGVALAGCGYVAPFVLVIVTLALEGTAGLATALAGALMIAGQVHAKWVLVLGVASLRPVTLANLKLQRRSS